MILQAEKILLISEETIQQNRSHTEVWLLQHKFNGCKQLSKISLKDASFYGRHANSTDFRDELKSYVDTATWAWYKDLPYASR